MMPSKWQRNDLRRNVQVLSQFRAYQPIFAVPFGRSWDWTEETIRLSRNQGLEIVLADGGINLVPGDFYRRSPSDGASVGSLLTSVMAGMS